MNKTIIKRVIKSSLDKIGDDMTRNLCPLILYQPNIAKRKNNKEHIDNKEGISNGENS